MADIVDLTAEPGAVGWHVVDEPHRCSRKHCPNPAVVYYLGHTFHSPRRWTRRFICAAHMNSYNGATPWWVDGDRILRERYPYEVE